MTSYIHILLGWMLLVFPLRAFAQGYSIDGNRLVVEGEELWQEWSYPKGTLTFEDDGSFHPIYIRKNVNACLDASSFTYGDDIRGGIRDAGSNQEDALNVMDGDIDTYWEPDRSDTLSDWWIQIDLGRVVAATRIVVKFVEEGEGDPFLGFKVWTSSGEIPVGKEKMDWRGGGKVMSNEGGRREFAFELSPPKGNEGEGDQVQYVWVIVTQTDGEKKEEIAKEEYESLEAGWRGAIEYYRIGPTREELLIREKGYYALPEEERGSIRYHRREVPRLAEVEVWTLGDNIALEVFSRERSPGAIRESVDGSFSTGVHMGVSVEAWGISRFPVIQMDFGAVFWVDAVRVISPNPKVSSFGGRRGFRVRVSDGSFTAEGIPVWETMSLESQYSFTGWDDRNTGTTAIYIEEVFVPRKVRVLDVMLTLPEGNRAFSISEIQVYGEGYVSGVTLTSPLIPIGKGNVLGTIHWDAEIPPDTHIEIYTRTGDNLRAVTRYFDQGGTEITLARYTQLPGFARGEARTEYVPAEGWSDWSRPYQLPGDLVTSPNPREHLQIQLTFLSDTPEMAPALRSLWINASTSLSYRITGEIAPAQIVRAGIPDTLSLFLHPSFLPNNPGFDGVLLHSSFPIEMKLVKLRIGEEQDFLQSTTHDLSPEDVRILPTSPDSLVVYLPYTITSGGADLVEVQFETTIFLDNTSFEAFLLNSSYPDPQKVDEGDATSLVDNQTMHVEIPMDSRIIRDVEIVPNPFTPNGDGINDEVTISFSVFKVFAQKTATVEVYDISGRRIREFEETREVGSGRYDMVWDGRVEWDGRDDVGRVVNPGVYVVRIHVGVDVPGESASHYTRIRSVGVVY